MRYQHGVGLVVPFAQKHIKQLVLAVAAIFIASMAMMSLSTQAAVTAWDQGFETDTTDWSGTITRVPTGTDGVTSSTGAFHAEVDDDTTTFSRFGGYSSVWPGTWTAEVDVYLDTNWASGEGFEYSVAANGSDGAHQRDFIFHVSKDTDGNLYVAGSNNSGFNIRDDLDTINHHTVTESGWYTLQHVFRDNGSGVLAVDLNLLDDTNAVIFTETRSDASDVIATQIGGNRYGWFTVVNVPNDLAIDNHQLVLNNGSETEVNVYGNTGVQNQKGAWMFNRDATTATPFEFNNEEASIGEGSIEILPIGANASDKFIAEYFARESIANFNSFSYDFKIAGNGDASDANQFYVNFYTTYTDATNFYNCRFDFVPTVGSTTDFTTFSVTRNTVANNVGGVGCPTTLAGMPAGSYIRAIAINVGDTSASDVGLGGYLDNAVITLTNSNSTIFDFEPNVFSKEACKNGGWVRGLSDGRQFKNQGDCVSYFATKTKNPPRG